MGDELRITSDDTQKLKCPQCGKSYWEGRIFNYGETAALNCYHCGYEVEFGKED